MVEHLGPLKPIARRRRCHVSRPPPSLPPPRSGEIRVRACRFRLIIDRIRSLGPAASSAVVRPTRPRRKIPPPFADPFSLPPRARLATGD